MTEGNIVWHILAYAVPMIFGNILQLTYNAVDSIIIGKCLGEGSLAAVSSANPVMTIMILGASGMGVGGSVLISRFYGASKMEKVKREFSTIVIFGVFFSLIIFLLGAILSGPILRAMHTPEEIMDLAQLYLRIILVGFLFSFQFNMISSAMRGMGDSSTPVFFLGISCVINVLLDLLLVAGLHMGVAGAGLATCFAEAISVICCVVYIYRKEPALSLRKHEWQLDRGLLKETLAIGSLSALQGAAQPIGKVIIQSVINARGIVAIGAFNAVCRLDDFACIPTQSIGSAIMTCTAQNRGAGNEERVKASLSQGLKVNLGYFPIICSLTLLFRYPFMRLLTPKGSTEMIAMGAAYLAVKAWFFLLPCITNSIQGFFRGVAKMNIVLLCTVIQISIRTVLVSILVPKIGITGEAYACLIGWVTMAVFEYTYYFYYRRK
ncbi:MAG: MATE family efflux transporter [Clostridiales bacterium]|nr:MATE family efflux transporter [Candidatus Blautia equi]